MPSSSVTVHHLQISKSPPSTTSVRNTFFHRWKTAELFLLIFLIAAHLSEAFSSYLIFANHKEIRQLNDDNQRPNAASSQLVNNQNQSWTPAAANTSVLVGCHLEVPAALDFDYAQQIIFWSDTGYETISGLRLGGGGGPGGPGPGPCPGGPGSPPGPAHHQTHFDVITENIESPEGLAVDWLTHKLYWADSEANRIEVARYDGSLRSLLFWTDLEQPRALVLVPPEALLFWCSWGPGQARIERASMDGDPASRRVIRASRDLLYPNGLTVDYEARRLYYIDAKADHIASVDYEGGHLQTVDCGYPIHPFAITLDGSRSLLYWTDIVTQDVHRCDLVAGASRRLNVTGSENQVVVVAGQNSQNPNNHHHHHQSNPSRQHHQQQQDKSKPIVLFSPDRQPFSVPGAPHLPNISSSSACLVDNGGCSHLCLLSSRPPTFASCACPTGVRLRPDNRTCPDRPDAVLLIARRTDIRRVSLDTADFTTMTIPLEPLPTTTSSNPQSSKLGEGRLDDSEDDTEEDHRGTFSYSSFSSSSSSNAQQYITVLDYDPVEGRLYWAEEDRHQLVRAFLNGSGVEVIVSTELHHPDGLAVDWLGRNLYWTDAGTDRLEVARLDGSARTILLSEGLERPRAIVLHPVLGLLYWSDWGRRPKIERSALDGSGRRVLVDEAIGWPNGLAIDSPAGRLYWCDGKLHTIESVTLDGADRQVVFSEPSAHFFGFTVFQEWAYWSDMQGRSVERVLKQVQPSGEKEGQQQRRQMIVDALPDMLGIKAVWVGGEKMAANLDGYDPEVDNPCGTGNGGCSHLCLKRSRTEAVCVCPAGYELLQTSSTSDRKTTTTTTTTCVQSKAYFLVLREGDIRSVSTTSLDAPSSASSSTAKKPGLDVMAVSGVHAALAFDVDVAANTVYWIEASPTRKAIFRSLLNGSRSELVVALEPTGEASPHSLAVDWIAKNVYWSDTGVTARRIEVIRADGSFRRVVVKGGDHHDHFGGGVKKPVWPHDIVVDPTVGYLFWTDHSTITTTTNGGGAEEVGGGTVERAFLDGEGQLTVARGTGAAWALTADYLNRRLYWLQKSGEKSGFKVVSSSYSGEGGLAVITLETPSHPLSSNPPPLPVSMVTLGDDLLYLLEPSSGVISSLNRTSSALAFAAAGNQTQTQSQSVKTEVVKESPELTTAAALFLYQGRGLSQRGWNFCAVGNGRCEQLCFARSASSSAAAAVSIADQVHCSCATHYRLASDGRSCLEPNSFLLFSHRHEVTRFLFERRPPPRSKGKKRKVQPNGRSSDHLEEVTVSLGGGEDGSGNRQSSMIKALAYDQPPLMAAAAEAEDVDDENVREDLNDHHNPGWIYWIEPGKTTDRIKRARLNGTGVQVVFETEETEGGNGGGGGGQLVDLLIDSPSRLLLWTSASSNSIAAGRLIDEAAHSSEGILKPLGVIFHSPADRPRLLAYHAGKHFLFWSNDLQSATIERLTLTASVVGGPPKTTVVGGDSSSSSSSPRLLLEVLALTVDPALHYLLWADRGGAGSIEYSDLDGRHRQVLYSEPNIEPVALTTHARLLFWAEGRARRTVEKVPLDLNQGRNKQTLFKRTTLITDLIAVQPPPRIQKGNSTSRNCLEENGGCSHLCVAVYGTSASSSSKSTTIITGRQCACPRGLVLGRDGRRCTEPIHCDAGQRQFACANGIACIDALFRCNGWAECADSSDELHCPRCTAAAAVDKATAGEESLSGTAPRQQQFTCLQQLDSLHQWTGGALLGGGQNAETSKASSSSSFSPLICLEEGRLCDGKKDCFGGVDELCCADKFRCNSRHCLTADQLCDGKKDCADGEDEQATVCELYTRRASVVIRGGGGGTLTGSHFTSTSTTGLSLFLIIVLSTVLLLFAVLQCKRCLATATAAEAKHKQQQQQQQQQHIHLHHHPQNQSFLMTERGVFVRAAGDTTSTSTAPSRFNRNPHKRGGGGIIRSLLLQRQKSSEQTTCNTLTSTTTVLSLGQMGGVGASAASVEVRPLLPVVPPVSDHHQSSIHHPHHPHHHQSVPLLPPQQLPQPPPPHQNNNSTDHSSSSSSPAVVYPCETVNPPPSPCTERSHSTAYSSSALFVVTRSNRPKQMVGGGNNSFGKPAPNRGGVGGNRHRKRSRLAKQRHQQHPHHHYHHLHQPPPLVPLSGPPPTPCGTDIYEDDLGPPIQNKNHPFYSPEEDDHHRHLLFAAYKPPPPTPRQYFSDAEEGDGGGCPPSPVTEHSFLGAAAAAAAVSPSPPLTPLGRPSQEYEAL